MKFHHLGIATKDIKEGIKKANTLFNVLNCSDIIHDENQNADLCMLTTDCGLQIELISGITVERFIQRSHYLYHSCFEVDNLEEAIEQLVLSGGTVVSKPKPAVLFDMRRVAFVFCFMGIIELLEVK